VGRYVAARGEIAYLPIPCYLHATLTPPIFGVPSPVYWRSPESGELDHAACAPPGLRESNYKARVLVVRGPGPAEAHAGGGGFCLNGMDDRYSAQSSSCMPPRDHTIDIAPFRWLTQLCP
jgi:hypothetical protein